MPWPCAYATTWRQEGSTTASERSLHPSSLLFGIGGQLRAFVLPALLLLFAARSRGFEAWMFVAVVPSALFAAVRALSLRYRYDADELVIRTGFVFRNERHIPFARIHDLRILQNPFHRLLRVAEVRVETAGGEEPEARLQVLSLGAVEEMRRRLREARAARGAELRGSGAVEGGAAAGPPEEVLLQLPPSELVVLGLLENRGMVVVAAALGLAWELELFERFWDPATVRVRGLVEPERRLPALGFPVVLGGAAAALALLAAIRILSVGWTLVKLHGFTLSSAGRDLRTSGGLLTRVRATVPARRIQLLTVSEPLLYRLARRASVRVDTAGGATGAEGEEAGRRWLAPVVRRAALPQLLHRIAPEADPDAAEWRSVDPRARRRLLRGGAIAALVVALAVLPLSAFAAAVALVLLLALTPLHARLLLAGLGYALGPDAVLFRRGRLTRHLTAVRYEKVQAVAVHQSPFDRRWGMATLQVDTAGATAHSVRVSVPYLPADIARGLFTRIGDEAARSRFQW